MELVYLWINEYRNINNKGFNFSNKYNIDFPERDNMERKITIKELPNRPNLFGEKIGNITSIIGKNASGKTTILDLLGVKRLDRQGLGKYNDLKYFIIYWISGSKFVIEGSNFNLIKGSFKNSEQQNWNFLSEPYSIIVELENDELHYKSVLYSESSEKHSINYFNFRYRYSGNAYQHFQSMTIENEHSHLFNRINLSQKNTGYQAIYKMIIELNKKDLSINKDNFMFAFHNNLNLKIKFNMYLNDEIKLNIDKGFEAERDIFKPNVIKSPRFNSKIDFINKFLYKYCHSLASQFFILPDKSTELSKLKDVLKSLHVSNNDYYDYYLKIIEIILDFQVENDQYFTYKGRILDIIKIFCKHIYQLETEWFTKENITIPLYSVHNQYLEDFLKFFDEFNFTDDELQSLVKAFSIEFYPFSAGEEALLSLFSALYFGLSLNYNHEKGKAIILLDEPDNFMHPEWSRLLLQELCSFLNRIDNGYLSYQLIITTHSPFIISDLPKDAIIALDKNTFTGDCVQVPIADSFAANIHTLLAQDFFMKSTIGEFAKNKINDVITKLKEPNHLSEADKEEINYIISIIGEPLIKQKLKIMAENSIQKEETINMLKARLLELEKHDPNQEK
ncbi:AAA family ATPase [Niallia taxi]|uniref:AAA family ATPase n=1 Tax=Niallia taxi TaxID=2499688 RepID=UPI003D276060